MRLIRMLRLLVPILVISLSFLSFAAYAAGPLLPPKPASQTPGITNPYGPPQDTITITNPQSGAIWYTGAQQPIQWTFTGISSSQVTVTLWKDNELIDTIGTSNTGKTAYTVPFNAFQGRGNYEVRVTGHDARVEARQPIAVERASVHFTSPKAGEKWLFDSPQTITWTYTGDPGPFKLTLSSSDNFMHEVILASNVSPGTGGQGHASVTAPMPPEVRNSHNPYIIRAHRMADNRQNGLSDSFRIEFPHITVTSPKAGQTLQVGVPTVISWTYEPQRGTVKIEVLDSAYKTVDTVASTAPAQLGNIPWTPPKTLPAGSHPYYVNITNPVFILGSGQSMAFTIVAPTPPVDPLLVGAEAVFNTTSENKDHDTAVYVRVTDKTSNKDVASVSGAATSSGDSTEYKSNSRATLRVVYNTATHKSACNNLKVTVGSKATGKDTWTFNGTVTLYFADGTQIVKKSMYERVLHSANSQYTEIDLEGPYVQKWPDQAQPATPATNCNKQQELPGYRIAGMPGCASNDRANHPSAYRACDSTGYYCCENSQGAKTKCGINKWTFPADCMMYCASAVGNCMVQPVVQNGVFYGCYTKINPK